MQLEVLGACGAWPSPGEACSGYLVTHDGFRLLLDIGYAVFPRLTSPYEVDAVFVTHGHPDHCADLNPLLRARALGPSLVSPLPIYAPPGALNAVLALDRPGMLEDAYVPYPYTSIEIGPFQVRTALLPHWETNAGIRLTAGGRTITYTGDCGPSEDLISLAQDADLLLAEATFPVRVPDHSLGNMSSATDAGREASSAGVGRLVLTHLLPGTDPQLAAEAARETYDGPIDVARSGLIIDVAGSQPN